MRKIIFLVSGNGGHLRFLYEAISLLNLPIEIMAVIADRNCEALFFAQKNNICTHQIEYSQTKNKELHAFLQYYQADLIITNWHKIIDNDTLQQFPSQFLNLHYSLLPSFKGLIGMKTLTEAAKLNVQFIGNTCHFVDEFVDNGKIYVQSIFAVDWKNDDKKDLQNIMFQSACYTLLNGILCFFEIENHKKYPTYSIFSKEIYTNPALRVDSTNFSTVFWKKIANDSL